MRKNNLSRRSFLTVVAGVPLWLALPSGRVVAATLQIHRLRHWSAPDHTRLVLDLDLPARFETRLVEPQRLVLEISGAQLDDTLSGVKELRVEDGLVRSVTLRQLATTVLLVVELERDSDHDVFALPPNAGSSFHRVVLDVRKRWTDAEMRAQEREAEAVRRSGDVVVAIDAGHGGNDPGCLGHKLKEKEVALDVSRHLAAALAARTGFRAVLTRESDYFLPLGKRPRVAQRFGAHLFLSIHANSARSASARGAEIFFLSLRGAADKAARELVDRENAADQVGGVPQGREGTALTDILWSLKQDDTIRRSERLGEVLLRSLERIPGSESRGLKQGPLAVLKSIASPSVLVELGFLTNRRDARLLRDVTMRKRYAQELAKGVVQYVETSL